MLMNGYTCASHFCTQDKTGHKVQNNPCNYLQKLFSCENLAKRSITF